MFVVFLIAQQFRVASHERILEGIVKCIEMDRERDEVQDQTDSLIVANINKIYELLDIEWRIWSVKRDSTKEKKK